MKQLSLRSGFRAGLSETTHFCSVRCGLGQEDPAWPRPCIRCPGRGGLNVWVWPDDKPLSPCDVGWSHSCVWDPILSSWHFCPRVRVSLWAAWAPSHGGCVPLREQQALQGWFGLCSECDLHPVPLCKSWLPGGGEADPTAEGVDTGRLGSSGTICNSLPQGHHRDTACVWL